MQETIKSVELSDETIWRLGQEIYDRVLKTRIEPAHRGEFVIINVVNGDYFLDPNEDRAIDLAQTRYPDAVFYIGRVGFPAVDRLGHQGHFIRRPRSERARRGDRPYDVTPW